ncbi:nuclease-related domain-containing protein [Ammoniphilus sp. YIM 78166]|uniref:nuclease-related domain-containing protein n=1 Tax=Ammoniphilus sp. YIM 78166 TaxID=1644106 RepID=UPI0014304F9A|nr:nuclease-related domain-containing protein [Ammoniphilus sp. YIM 78166]
MIKKERENPPTLKKYEALLRLLPTNHPKRKILEEEHRNIRAGYHGEKELDYHLSLLPEDEFLIFQGLHLPKVQMDTLLLSPSFGVIIESKNFSGTLHFDSESGQFTRTLHQNKQGFSDPILQVNRQKLRFQQWLTQHKVKPLPLHVLVAISFPSTLLETDRTNSHIFKIVTHAERIPSKILALPQAEKPMLSLQQLKKLTTLLLQENTSPSTDILQKHPIHPRDFTPGIPCPNCKPLTMTRAHGLWICPHCQHKDKLAHLQPIQDYLAILGQLSNQQCQQLLQLPSPQLVSRLLAAMKLPHRGQNKGRIYLSPEL